MQSVEQEKSEPTEAMAPPVVVDEIGVTVVGNSRITSGQVAHGFSVETHDRLLVVRFAETCVVETYGNRPTGRPQYAAATD